MELRQLRAFVAVVDTGGFHAAAGSLGISQPSLSQRIARLEDHLDQPLFDRLGQHVTLTPAGRALLDTARAILTQADAVPTRIAHAARAGADHLALGIPDDLSPALVARAIRDVRSDFPACEVELRECQPERLPQRLIDGTLDLAILVEPIEDSRLKLTPLAAEPLLLVVPASSPMSSTLSARIPLDRSALIELGAIICDGPSAGERWLVELCRGSGVAQLIRCGRPRVGTKLELVRHGLGVALIPKLAFAGAADPALRVVEIEGDAPTRSLVIARHAARVPGELSRAMINALVQAANESLEACATGV